MGTLTITIPHRQQYQPLDPSHVAPESAPETRECQHLLEQTSHLTATTNVTTGRNAGQSVLNPLSFSLEKIHASPDAKHPQSDLAVHPDFRLCTPRGQHRCLALRNINSSPKRLFTSPTSATSSRRFAINSAALYRLHQFDRVMRSIHNHNKPLKPRAPSAAR